ncbi:hypothetical protein BpHYR1_047702 [Brachionus plicatilis]|uniref:Uncharacterized protein n=1 Tax=Brachionus plicatilis TaxID=10195 RepID=A0A3M7RY07_BRAPC|nr:hypothetical protein BpHYR1_047702 [Brachionus plicatilis]
MSYGGLSRQTKTHIGKRYSSFQTVLNIPLTIATRQSVPVVYYSVKYEMLSLVDSRQLFGHSVLVPTYTHR